MYKQSQESQELFADLDAQLEPATTAAIDAHHAALEANYMDELRVLRADIIIKLLGHQALHNSHGWAFFNIQEADDEGSLDTRIPRKLVAVFINSRASNGLTAPAPYIRVVMNELVSDNYDSPDIITADFTADGNDETWYHLDVVSPLAHNANNTFGTRFKVTDTSSLIFVGEPQTPYVSMWFDKTDVLVNEPELNTTLIPVAPYGNRGSLLDKIHALVAMREVFGSIQQLEPVYSYQPTE